MHSKLNEKFKPSKTHERLASLQNPPRRTIPEPKIRRKYMELTILETITLQAEKSVGENLRKLGIQTVPLIKVKAPTGRNKTCMGVYKSGSIYRTGKPIIWINPNIQKSMKKYGIPLKKTKVIVEDTILHEFAHTIVDLARFQARKIGGTDTLLKIYEQFFHDEEEYAEGFIAFCREKQEEGYPELINEFNKLQT